MIAKHHKIISLKELQDAPEEVLADLEKTGGPTYVTIHGRPCMVLQSIFAYRQSAKAIEQLKEIALGLQSPKDGASPPSDSAA